jgi:HK97 family phage prohead protease
MMHNKPRTLTIEGYASIFNEPDQLNDVIFPGAFSLKDVSNIPLLWQHYPNTPIGKIISAKEDKVGLWVTLALCIDTQVGIEAYKLIQSNILTGLSFGFKVIKSSKGQGRVRRVLHKVSLQEISVVTFPAHPKARIKYTP